MRQRSHIIYTFPIEKLSCLKRKMLNLLRQFSIFSFMDNNGYSHAPNHYECIMAAGAHSRFYQPESLPKDDWLFGHIAYDFGQILYPYFPWKEKGKQAIPAFTFFQPDIVCRIPYGSNQLHISCIKSDPNKVLEQILKTESDFTTAFTPPTEWTLDFTKEEYLKVIDAIRSDIREGDFYELNFCVRATTKHQIQDPFSLFYKLNKSNPSPFAAFYRLEDDYLLCASPERFLQKQGHKLTAQPIKGTIRNSPDKKEDEQLQQALKNDLKEQAENLMITDLMRNDLAKICMPGSIRVPDLLGIYHFPTLHHLISTIEGRQNNQINFKDILEATFPMGSMTGAPKKIVMERIDGYERQQRGLYSGSVGYLSPEGDFDLNVVIRSLIYQEKQQELSYATGGAITYDSVGEQEWREINLKAAAIKALFE